MHKKSLVLFLVAILLFAFLLVQSDLSILHLVYGSDAYGNDIQFIEIWQYNGSTWNLLENFTSSGGSCRVHDAWVINFSINIKFNNTFASSTSEAIDYTRVYMNISESVWTNAELNNTSCSLVGDFYILEEQGHWNQTGKPESGVTYECSVLYQGYY